MASEKFANLAETTLSAGYTSGGSSISVTSAAGFPTVGTFRVRLGNTGKTIYRVDSVSGTTFTGGAEANDANANSGETVKIVASRASVERLIQSPEPSTLHAPSGISAADMFGPIWKLVPPDTSSWAWTNQSSSTLVVSNGVEIYQVTAGLSGVSMRHKSISSPFTLTAAFLLSVTQVASCAFGIGFRESGTGKICSFNFGMNTPGVQHRVIRWTNATTFASESNGSNKYVVAPLVWLRINYDGTNVTYSYSSDGFVFYTHLQEAKTVGFTTAPDQAGITMTSGGSGTPGQGTYVSLVES